MHLNFASLYHCSVQFFASSVGVRIILESYETKSLHAPRKNKEHALKFVQTNQCQYTYLHNSQYSIILMKHITHAWIKYSIHWRHIVLAISADTDMDYAYQTVDRVLLVGIERVMPVLGKRHDLHALRQPTYTCTHTRIVSHSCVIHIRNTHTYQTQHYFI